MYNMIEDNNSGHETKEGLLVSYEINFIKEGLQCMHGWAVIHHAYICGKLIPYQWCQLIL